MTSFIGRWKCRLRKIRNKWLIKVRHVPEDDKRVDSHVTYLKPDPDMRVTEARMT